MGTTQTGPDTTSAETVLAAIEPAERQKEARQLDALFREVTGFEPRIWAGGILGYGRYDYRYASGQAGQSLATGFARRKTEFVLYIQSSTDAHQPLLSAIGPHRAGKGCVYLKRLAGTDMAALGRLIRVGLDDLAGRWTIHPT